MGLLKRLFSQKAYSRYHKVRFRNPRGGFYHMIKKVWYDGGGNPISMEDASPREAENHRWWNNEFLNEEDIGGR